MTYYKEQTGTKNVGDLSLSSLTYLQVIVWLGNGMYTNWDPCGSKQHVFTRLWPVIYLYVIVTWLDIIENVL